MFDYCRAPDSLRALGRSNGRQGAGAEGTDRRNMGLVSLYNEQNSVKQYNLGENPLGMIMFDRSGNVIQMS